MLLVIDACTERLLVGVRGGSPTQDRWKNVDARVLDGPANHGRDLLPAIGGLLGGDKPLAVGVSVGPGSFTGVRIGLATAKGLAAGWNVPLLGLDNLAAMAGVWALLHPNSPAAVLPVIDARKNKFYAAFYREGREILAPADLSAEAWVDAVRASWSGPVALSGYQGSHLAARLGALPDGWTVLDLQDWTPGLLDQAEAAWKARRFLDPDAAPRYLRLSEAEENLRSRSG